jgi:uncharacterized membrane protein YsdA (DUF1294 family)
MEIYVIIIALMSLITFALYAIDKKRAIKNQWRIKEKVLLLCSFLFGSVGGMFALYGLRHKNRHWYFVAVNFISLIIHIYLGYLIFKWKGFMYI